MDGRPGPAWRAWQCGESRAVTTRSRSTAGGCSASCGRPIGWRPLRARRHRGRRPGPSPRSGASRWRWAGTPRFEPCGCRAGSRRDEIVTAETLANPVLRFDLTHLQDGADGLGWDARLSWAPPQPGVRGGRIGAAQATLTEYDWQLREQEWALVCNVRAAYSDCGHRRRDRIADASVANRRKLVELIKRQVEQGGSTRFNIDLVTLSFSNAERAQSARKLARLTPRSRSPGSSGWGRWTAERSP